MEHFDIFKGRSRRLRPKAHILDDPFDNPYDGSKVLQGPPYGPRKVAKRDEGGGKGGRLLLLESDSYLFWKAIRDLCSGPRAHKVALRGLFLKRHKGCPRGHLRCELWVLIGDFSH